ncbi:acyl-CoA N-acyltransferase [Stemphylium lycopersici]|uniref:Acyl-CoA N-acyltransferase n=1 Tax=Stemphylium lycopersici TaxID=183478 RepID=A0A364MYA0_STELY|nr:acetyltransferase gnat family [Stemphylium lycopersici]RAR01145.1 acyl-CoA N-acyltransferase [Stemphylium lycopersici]RAR06835.1 acyl-CoA N-acyltransferase [Stemphylium lycopersici]
MAQQKAVFIKVPTDQVGFQTMPVEPERRMKDTEISVKICTENDAEKIAEGLYACFPEDWWERKEPAALRPAQHIRVQRLSKRLIPCFSHPTFTFIKAVLNSTGETIGVAGWTHPENQGVHTVFRRSAFAHYGWQERLGWSDAELAELFEAVSNNWNEQFAKDDEERNEVMKGEPHWYLAPLITWPEFQGRGVGTKLLNWAISQADATEPVTPMYLESRPSARAVYMHKGFVPVGQYNMVRRGPAVVRGLEAEEEEEEGKEVGKAESVGVQIVAKETGAETVG